jgi:hypothetical protein
VSSRLVYFFLELAREKRRHSADGMITGVGQSC